MKYSLQSLVIVVALLSVRAAAEEGKNPLPPEFESRLKWLPENTETLVGAAKFTVTAKSIAIPLGGQDLMPHLRLLILAPIIVLDEGKVWEPLAEEKISLALSGGRNFETVSAFGSQRSEGCTVIVFENELAERGQTWLKGVRPRAKEIRKIGEREVLVFPSTVVMEGAFELKPWQGTFIVLLDSKTLLCATSDAFLKETLERIDRPVTGRSLPNKLLEWKSLDPASLVWMIRHVPDQEGARRLEGIVWNQSEKESKVNYFPAPGKSAVIEKFARRRWTRGVPGKSTAKVERTPGGLVTVSAATGGSNESDFLLALNHYVLLGESGSEAED